MQATDDKARSIAQSARQEHGANALDRLAEACALLTSQSKDEREKGKAIVRRWKHSNSYELEK